MPFDALLYNFPLKNVARRAQAITPSDTASLPNPVAVYVGTSGNIAVVDIDDNVTTFSSVPAGGVLPVYVMKVLATGTTASGLVGLS